MCDAALSPRILISGADGKMSNYVRAVRAAGLYGQPDQGSQPPDPARDQAELELFRAFYQAGRPILGVCRGMQVINVALGGTLLQDLGDIRRPSHTHPQADQVHPVRAQPGSLLHTLYGPRFSVNSSHHQAAPPQGWSSPSGRWTAFPRPWSTPPSPFWGSSSTRSG